MVYAIKLACRAEQEGEVPVGAVLVLDNCILGEGWNSSIKHNDPTAHAELIALRQGGLKMKNYRLLGSSLYVTLEPCIMCTGALINSRISRLIFGARSKKVGSATSYLNNYNFNFINHKISITHGVLSERCSKQLKEFFYKRRKI